jgi:hydrolase, P-loop family
MNRKVLNFEEIDELVVKMARKLRKGGCLGLIGDLGAGKTTFTKKICKEYNINENIKSPTFTYVIEYQSGDVTVYHFDAYRIINSEEIYEIGFEDYIGEENSVVIVEWANNIIDEMPEDTIYVEINHNGENTREVSVYQIEDGEKKYVDICDNDND